MDKQPRALRIADDCEESAAEWRNEIDTRIQAAEELRRLYEQNIELLTALGKIFDRLDDGPDAPGHDHITKGHWDDSGNPCKWCATWERARAAIAKAEAEEGCTPADARKLREANHALAQEIHELRERLAQPDPEPVAWVPTWAIDRLTGKLGAVADPITWGISAPLYSGSTPQSMPLYTAPPRREWQGLTDEEILEVLGLEGYDNLALENARAIETALKEKNNG